MPASPAATPVGPYVATWTSQDGTEPPRFYVSRKTWGDQRRPEPGQALHLVPWSFRGRTVSEIDTLAHGTWLPSWPEDVFCHIRGGLYLHGDGHDQSLFYQSRAKGKNCDVIEPQCLDDPTEHPDVIWCFSTRLARASDLLLPPCEQPDYRGGCFNLGNCATETANATHQRLGRA